MRLPAEFEERMKGLLGEEYPAFRESYEKGPYQALRVNSCRIDPEKFVRLSPFALRPVPWAKDGFYYGSSDRPGKHPWHEAGLYYIQEPSAMAVAALACAKPGERVLDLCAAPGGKTTQLAASMKGEGLLVSNEIHPGRAKILSSNVERMGIPGAVVTNETPKRLAERFPAFFDRIVVDAPCSGEGMFRKEEQALLQWSSGNVAMCAARQQEILEEAARMLCPGGILVYSTCTFAPEEDEGSVASFLDRHPDFAIEKVKGYEGFAPGRPEWAASGSETGRAELSDTFRLWPHRLKGEGHYAAVLRKEGRREGHSESARRGSAHSAQGKGKGRLASAETEAFRLYQEFARESLKKTPEGIPVLFGEQLYLLPCALDLRGLKVLRAGLQLGTVRKGRFEPAHALSHALRAEDARQSVNLAEDSQEVWAYLRGESLELQEGGQDKKGWALVLAGGFPLGWGKFAGGMLKNHYPKGLRVYT